MLTLRNYFSIHPNTELSILTLRNYLSIHLQSVQKLFSYPFSICSESVIYSFSIYSEYIVHPFSIFSESIPLSIFNLFRIYRLSILNLFRIYRSIHSQSVQNLSFYPFSICSGSNVYPFSICSESIVLSLTISLATTWPGLSRGLPRPDRVWPDISIIIGDTAEKKKHLERGKRWIV